jgi:ribose/xylose/arabinose/galactoside ABC-type transport system permease subunit
MSVDRGPPDRLLRREILAAVTIIVVPQAMLGPAQAFVIVSGRGGIDLSVG